MNAWVKAWIKMSPHLIINLNCGEVLIRSCCYSKLLKLLNFIFWWKKAMKKHNSRLKSNAFFLDKMLRKCTIFKFNFIIKINYLCVFGGNIIRLWSTYFLNKYRKLAQDIGLIFVVKLSLVHNNEAL